MKDYQKLYTLHKDVSKGQLKALGFKVYKGTAHKKYWVYDDIIKIVFQINLDEGTFEYEVRNADHHCLYAPYYYYDCGKNLMLEEVIENVDAEFRKLAKQKILWRKRK